MGVLSALCNACKWIENNDEHALKYCLDARVHLEHIFPDMEFEGIANRDSTLYMPLYGLEKTVKTMFRGTLRFPPFCDVAKAFREAGLLVHEEDATLAANTDGALDWPTFLAAHNFDVTTYSQVVQDQFEKLHLTDKATTIPAKCKTPREALCGQLYADLAYKHDEVDLLALAHVFGAAVHRETKERITVVGRVLETGVVGGYSAMAKTVGLPTSVTAELILDGLIKDGGVHIPVREDHIHLMLPRLLEAGISFTEETLITPLDVTTLIPRPLE